MSKLFIVKLEKLAVNSRNNGHHETDNLSVICYISLKGYLSVFQTSKNVLYSLVNTIKENLMQREKSDRAYSSHIFKNVQSSYLSTDKCRELCFQSVQFIVNDKVKSNASYCTSCTINTTLLLFECQVYYCLFKRY